MSTPPPPPAGQFPPQPPAGYQAYGQQSPQQQQQQKTSGLAVGGFVLSLVALIPCFWLWFTQIPGYVGLVLSAVGLQQTKQGRRGRGLAIAGLAISAAAIALAVALSVWAYTSDRCTHDGLFSIECTA